MSTALTRKSRKIAKAIVTEDLSDRIRKLRASISTDTSLLQACEKELSKRRAEKAKATQLKLEYPDGD